MTSGVPQRFGFPAKPTLRKFTSTYDLPNFPFESPTKTPGFGVHVLPSMSTPTLILGLMRDDHPSFVDLRKKSELLSLHPLLLSLLDPALKKIGFSPFCPPFILINLSLLSGSCHAKCPLWSRVRFCNEMIHLFLVQFILNELSSSHFLTYEIFVKISSLESLVTHHHQENRKNYDCFRIRRNFSGSLDFARRIQRRSPFHHPKSREFSRIR